MSTFGLPRAGLDYGHRPLRWIVDCPIGTILIEHSNLEHYKTLCAQDPQQAILEELEKLKAEKAALKASQVPDPNNSPPPPPQTGQPSQASGQPNQASGQPGQASLGNYFAPLNASPTSNAPGDPMETYRRKDGTAFFAVHQPGTEAKVRDWVNDMCPKIDKNKCIKVLIAFRMS